MSEGTLQDCSKGRFLPVSPASQASPGATPRGCNRWLIVVLLAQVLAWIAAAQSPLPDAFKPGINGEVYALAVQADGKILVGGSFTWLDGQTCSNLARLNPDGTLDSSFFAPQPSGAVRALAVQADGKIVVGGRYAVLGGRWRENLARLNPDGTLEAGFRPSTSGEVRALAVQADGKIVVGGYFNSLNGPWCAGIGRLNADGTLETAFGYDLNPVEVSAVAVQADGKILMGGAFARDIGGFYRYRIARWNADGRLDETFNPGDFSHNSAAVETVAVQPDGKILLGGTFTNLAGHACYRIARLYASGAFESSFGLGADDSVSAFALQADGGIIVAGSFTTMDGQPRNRLARFNADGTLDNTFNPGASGPVKALAVQADGKVLLSGTFTSLAGQSRTNLARLNSAAPALRNLARGVSDINWQRGGTSPEVWRTLFEQSIDGVTWTGLGAGSRVAGGWQITGVSTAPNATIRARGFVIGGRDNGSGWLVEDYCGAPLLLNPPASQQVNAGFTATFNVRAVGSEPISLQWYRNGAAFADGSNRAGSQTALLTVTNVQQGDEGGYHIVLSNSFGSLTSVVATLTVLDPGIINQPASQNREIGEVATFSVTPAGSGPFRYQWWKEGTALAQSTGAELTLTNLLATDAGSYSVVVCNGLGCLTSSVALLTVNATKVDAGFDAGTSDNAVYSIAGQTDGQLLAGGSFYNLGGLSRPALARLQADGRADSAFNASAAAFVYSLVVQTDGRLLAGGSFTTLGGATRNYLGRLNPDGTLDSGFNPGADSWVYSLTLQENGQILVGGSFATLGGTARSRIGRLNPDGTLDASFNPGADNTVCTMVVQPDGKILVGGSFTTLGGQPRTNLARLYPDGTLDNSFNPVIASEEWPSQVSSLALQADGKILVGGTFSALGGQPRANLARLNADGTLDPDFKPQVEFDHLLFPPSVVSLVVQTDGKILMGGDFITVAGQPRKHLARLNANGTLDLTFNPVTGDDSLTELNAVMVQADGKILAGGSFKSLGGQPRTNLARLTTSQPATQSLSRTGSTLTWLRGASSPEVWRTTFDYSSNGIDWSSLGGGSRIAGGWQLDGLSLPSGGTVRARGFLAASYGNASSGFVETLLGAPVFTTQPLSQTFNAGSTASFNVAATGPEPLSFQWLKDGVPLNDAPGIAGAASPSLRLTNVLKAAEGSYRLVVMNPSGSVTSQVATLTVIDPVILSSPYGCYGEPGQSPTLSVMAGGTALSYQWWKDGTALLQGTSASLTLTNLQLGDAGNYCVVVSNQFGSLTSAVATVRVNLATLDKSFTPAALGSVSPVAMQADGKILVGGAFNSLAGQSRAYLGRLNPEGSLDTSFNPGANATLYSLAVQPDGKILAGGDFTSLAGYSRVGLGRLNPNGTLDTGFSPTILAPPPGYTRTVRVQVILLQPDGKLLIGGRSSLNGGTATGFVYRLNTNGTTDTTFVTTGDANGPVASLALQPDGKILVGGLFTYLRSQPRNRLGRLNADGTIDKDFNPNADNSVFALALQADGKILVGGSFATLASQPRTNLARLNPDGTLDSNFALAVTGGSFPTVYSVVVQVDGNILLSGFFTTVAGQARAHLARINSSGGVDPGFNPGPNSFVYGLALQADGNLLAVGDFSVLGGQPRTRIGRLHPTAPATQNLDYDGALVTWLRGGTSPEIGYTTFELSTNSTSWTLLGTGTRIAGGWQLSGLPALPAGRIRTRGCAVGGGFNASSWFVEQTLTFDPNTPPSIFTADGGFGFAGPEFGFNLVGPIGRAVVVEGSTNLLNWYPLVTNSFTAGALHFGDPGASNSPSRFYRTRLP